MKFLIFCFFFFVGSLCLYEYQAGVSDWSIRNIGEMDTVLFPNNEIFYLTLKDNDQWIGSAFVENGLKDFSRK